MRMIVEGTSGKIQLAVHTVGRAPELYKSAADRAPADPPF